MHGLVLKAKLFQCDGCFLAIRGTGRVESVRLLNLFLMCLFNSWLTRYLFEVLFSLFLTVEAFLEFTSYLRRGISMILYGTAADDVIVENL